MTEATAAMVEWTPRYFLHGSFEVGQEVYLPGEDECVVVTAVEPGAAWAERYEDRE